MGRRSDHSADQLRAMLVSAGETLVAEGGAAALTVRRVTGQIGYTPGTLYQHFSGIADLLLQVNGRTLDLLAQTLREGDAAGPAADRLYRLARLYLAFIRQNDHRWSALFELTLPQGTALPDWYPPKIEAVIAHVAEVFHALGPADAQTCREAAEMVWASIHAVCTLDASGKLSLVSGRTLERLIDDLVAVHVAAHRARQAASG